MESEREREEVGRRGREGEQERKRGVTKIPNIIHYEQEPLSETVNPFLVLNVTFQDKKEFRYSCRDAMKST